MKYLTDNLDTSELLHFFIHKHVTFPFDFYSSSHNKLSLVILFEGLCPQCSSTSIFICIVLPFYSGIADNVTDCKSGIYFKYLVDNCLNDNYTILINLQLFTPTCIMITGECFLLDGITSLEVNSFVLAKMIIKMVMI